MRSHRSVGVPSFTAGDAKKLVYPASCERRLEAAIEQVNSSRLARSPYKTS